MTMLPLVGRERELGVLDGLVDAVSDGGGAMVVCGEPGIGKSALLAMANRRATDRGMQVLTTTGVQSEAHLPFAGLHQLLRPIIAGTEDLPVRQRVALLAAFGMTEVAAPGRFLIALAALELLADTAACAPLLLIVEDAQWLIAPPVTCWRSSRGGWSRSRSCCWPPSGKVMRAPWGRLDCPSCAWRGWRRRRQPRC
jgi:hypothetical protein